MEILLVEDDLEDAGMTIEALKSGDVPCRLSLVRDGEEALRFLRRQGIFSQAPRPDLVLLDMQMPKMDGREVLREIRNDDRLKELPVLVMTASRVHRAILEGEGFHVEGYMTKPVSFEQFLRAVKSLRRDLLNEIVGPERAGRPG
jgi:CheY-like chemotaxis protein